MSTHTLAVTENVKEMPSPQLQMHQETDIVAKENASILDSLCCSLETISERTDEDSLIQFSPIHEENHDYFYSLTDQEGLMDLYDMYDLKPSFPLDC